MGSVKKTESGWPETRAHTKEGVDFRSDRRRQLVAGEKISCVVESQLGTHDVFIIDLSLRGLAFEVYQSEESLSWEVGERITLNFRRRSTSFSLFAKIVHMRKHGDPQVILCGVKFEIEEFKTMKEFTEKLGGSYMPCSSFIRPQASCPDDFFFRETQLFQVNGFTSFGLDLVVSARLKSILPGQVFELNVFIPGHSLFQKIRCYHAGYLYQSRRYDRYRIFCKLLDENKPFQAAMSSYLLMMRHGLTPKILRSLNYHVGRLDQIATIDAIDADTFVGLSKKFIPGILNSYSSSELNDKRSGESLTFFRFKIGATATACFSFHFIENVDTGILFPEQGFDFLRKLSLSNRLELNEFFMLKDADFTDLFVPLFIHFVRIAYNQDVDYLLLRADMRLNKVLHSIGLFKVPATMDSDTDQNYAHFCLDLKKIMADETTLSDKNIWQRVYSEVSAFLKDYSRRI